LRDSRQVGGGDSGGAGAAAAHVSAHSDRQCLQCMLM
jgi:hypothetical protein